MTQQPDNPIPDYDTPSGNSSAPVSYLAIASVIAPLFYTMIARACVNPKLPDLDQALGLSALGMFCTKLLIFPAVPCVAITLAIWSIHRIRKRPPLTGIPIAILAILLNLAIVAYETHEIYSLYHGYL